MSESKNPEKQPDQPLNNDNDLQFSSRTDLSGVTKPG